MSEIHNALNKYMEKSMGARAKMQSKLFTIFTETTGYRPEDICLVEQRIQDGLEFKTLFYFDLKHRYTHAEIPE